MNDMSMCKYWYEDGEPLQEICKASYGTCSCCAQIEYCNYPEHRERKEKEDGKKNS